MSDLKFARRRFLLGAARNAAFLGIGSSMFDRVVGELFGKSLGLGTGEALAATSNPFANESIYVHISLPGGPPRWYFDLPLNPSGKSADFVQGGFGNWIDYTGAKAKSVYKTESFKVGNKNVYLPPIWKTSVGGYALSDLLPNTAFIRGVDAEINSHPLSNARQVAPIINGLSLQGLAAESSKKPMAGLVASGEAGRAFRSRNGLAPVNFPTDKNPLLAVLTPFAPFSAAAKFQGQNWAQLRDQSLVQFEAYARKSGMPQSSLRDAYDNAITMIEENVYDISLQWPDLVAKYKAMITAGASVDANKAMFTKPVIADGTPEFSIGQDMKATGPDLREALIGMTTTGPTVANMAEQFAVAEALILNNLTSNVTISMAGLSNLKVNGSGYALTNDQHFIGRLSSTVLTTSYYRTLGGCLSEFTTALKKVNKFDHTVIHIAAEFNRTPRADGSGADHGPMGSNATLISGMIKQNIVIGNIQKSPADGNPGTWGVADKFNLGGLDRPIQVNDVALTVAAMLNYDSKGLITNGRALINPLTGLAVKDEANNV